MRGRRQAGRLRPLTIAVATSPATLMSSWVKPWAADSALLLTSQVVTVLMTSATAILIARSLEPATWGVFSAFIGLSLALAVIIVFGLATWLLRELAELVAKVDGGEARQRAGSLVSAAVVVNVALTLPLVVAGAVVALLKGFDAATALTLVALLVYSGLLAVASSLEAHLRAERRVKLVATAVILEKGVILVLVLVGLVLAGLGIGVLGVAYVAAGVVRISFDAVALFGGPARLPFVKPTFARLRAVARSSVPFAMTASAMNVLPRLDVALLATMSATSAGWFAVADRALGPALLIPATLASALYPFMARRSPRESEPWKIALALGAGGGVIAVIGIIAAPALIPFVFGSDYSSAVSVTAVMLLVLPFAYATSPLLVFAYSQGRERAVVLTTLGLSFAGTIAIVGGQAVGGADLAAWGAVFRSILLLAGIALVGLTIRRAPAVVGRRSYRATTTLPTNTP